MSEDFFHKVTMRGLASGLTVGMIASSPLTICSSTDDPESVLNKKEWLDFDAIPVRDGEKVIAVVERGTRQRRALDSSILVSSTQSLEGFLRTPSLADDGYRLVLTDGKIDGIVTPSDLLRLPVRVLALALLAQLEITMDRAYRAAHSPAEALNCVTTRGRERIEIERKRLAKENLNLDELDLTSFGDKVAIVTKLGIISVEDAPDALKIKKLRDELAHNREYIRDAHGLRNFVHCIGAVSRLIDEIVAWTACHRIGESSSAPSDAGDTPTSLLLGVRTAKVG